MRLSEIRKKIGRYQKRFLNKSSENTGDVKTRFRGSGLQFKEHQVYAPGDDVRFIDWKILAKTSVPFIKTFEEERSTEIHCIVDVGRSMLMGKDGVSKLQLALEFCIFLYYVAEKARDRVAITLVGDNVISLQGGFGELAINRFLKVLQRNGVINEKNIVNIYDNESAVLDENLFLTEIKKLSVRMKNVIVLSDFLDVENLETVLKMSSRNIHMVRISNGFEDEAMFYAIPFLYGGYGRILNRKKTNESIEDLLSSKTKRLLITSTFVDDFKQVLKSR